MRVAFVTSELPPGATGGIGSFVYQCAQGLRDRGHRVWVIGAFNGRDDWDPEKIDVRDVLASEHRRRMIRFRQRLARFAVGRTRRWWRELPLHAAFRSEIRALHRREGLELVEWFSCNGLFLGPVRGVADVVRLHGSHLSESQLGLTWAPAVIDNEYRTLGGIANWIGVSSWVVARCQSLYDVAPARSTVIYNPVDCELFSPAETSSELDEAVVLYVGSLGERKGSARLAAAANQFLRVDDRSRLVYVGPAEEVHRREVTEALAPDLHDRLTFIPYAPPDDLARRMRNAAVLAVPSLHETFGMVYAEAMAAGLPVVGGHGTAIPEIVRDGETGLLVDPRDPVEIAGAVSRLLTDADLREQMGRAGRAHAVANFGIASCLDETEAFYAEILAASRRERDP